MPGEGACVILDYEVNIMAEYITEMAIKLVLPQSPVSPSFRKFVSQILSSTRLPRATILLGMNYLSKRVNSLKTTGTFHPIKGQVWQMLIIALLLGSKFLDDNTFQNRTWSKVNGISVAEVNKVEAEWLVGIGWNLYVNLERSEDYNAWLENCSLWMGRKKMAQTLANCERLAALVPPIDTDFAGPRNQTYTLWHQQQVAEYEHLSKMKHTEQPQRQAGYRPQEIGYNQYSAGPRPSASLTLPYSGYGTPEYPGSATSGNSHFYGDWFNRALTNNAQAQHYSQNLPLRMPPPVSCLLMPILPTDRLSSADWDSQNPHGP